MTTFIVGWKVVFKVSVLIAKTWYVRVGMKRMKEEQNSYGGFKMLA